jgi:hypothetical protein
LFSDKTGALAGIIVAAVVVTLIVVGVVLWVHLRRRKSKSQELNVELSSHPPTQPVQTHFNLAMEPEAKMAGKLNRQNCHKVLRQWIATAVILVDLALGGRSIFSKTSPCL